MPSYKCGFSFSTTACIFCTTACNLASAATVLPMLLLWLCFLYDSVICILHMLLPASSWICYLHVYMILLPIELLIGICCYRVTMLPMHRSATTTNDSALCMLLWLCFLYDLLTAGMFHGSTVCILPWLCYLMYLLFACLLHTHASAPRHPHHWCIIGWVVKMSSWVVKMNVSSTHLLILNEPSNWNWPQHN